MNLGPIGNFEKNIFMVNNNQINKPVEYKIYIKKAKDKKFYQKNLKNYLNTNIENNYNNKIERMYTLPYKFNLRILSNKNLTKSKLMLKLVFLNTDTTPKENSICVENTTIKKENVLETRFYFNILSSKFNKNQNGSIFQFCIYINNEKIFTSASFKTFSRRPSKTPQKQRNSSSNNNQQSNIFYIYPPNYHEYLNYINKILYAKNKTFLNKKIL